MPEEDAAEVAEVAVERAAGAGAAVIGDLVDPDRVGEDAVFPAAGAAGSVEVAVSAEVGGAAESAGSAEDAGAAESAGSAEVTGVPGAVAGPAVAASVEAAVPSVVVAVSERVAVEVSRIPDAEAARLAGVLTAFVTVTAD